MSDEWAMVRKLALCLLFFGSYASARTVAIKAGLLLVDARQAPLQNAVLLVEDGRIKAAGAGLPIPPGAEVMDLSAFTVLPGLLDGHTHLYTGERADALRTTAAEKALYAQVGLRNALESGVTTLRVLGSNEFLDVALRNGIRRGLIPGPRVLAAAHALTIPGGHGDFFPLSASLRLENFYTPQNGFLSSPDQAEEAVHWQVRNGADVIKLLASGGASSPLDFPEQEHLSPAEIRRAVTTAHGLGKRVASHAENLRSIRQSLEAGVDSIEHGSELDAATLALLKQKRIYYDPCPLHRLEAAGKQPAAEQSVEGRKRRALFQKHQASFRLAVETGGVLFSAGSDVNYAPGTPTLATELVTQVRYGLSPQQALVSATVHNAELFELAGEAGTLEPGKAADLIAVRGNPLEAIQALERVVLVMKAGKVYADRRRATSED